MTDSTLDLDTLEALEKAWLKASPFEHERRALDYNYALRNAAPALISAARELAVVKAERDAKPKPKIAPVQGYAQGIPWDMHLRAYDAYCKQWGKQEALIDLEGRGCRGGFHTGELDMLIPGWRDELSELAALRAERDALRGALEGAGKACKSIMHLIKPTAEDYPRKDMLEGLPDSHLFELTWAPENPTYPTITAGQLRRLRTELDAIRKAMTP